MKRSSGRRSSRRELNAFWEAEDRLNAYLWNLPDDVAVVTAIRTATCLAEAWDREFHLRVAAGDQSYVYFPSEEDRCWLEAATEQYRSNPVWETCDAGPACRLLDTVSLDTAAYIASRVARSVFVRKGKR